MLTIYRFDNRRVWTGEFLEISDTDGAPLGWTFNAPPSVPEGKFGFFIGPDWTILDEYPPELGTPIQQANPISEPVVI